MEPVKKGSCSQLFLNLTFIRYLQRRFTTLPSIAMKIARIKP